MGSEPWDSSRPDGAGTPDEPVLWNAFANMASLAGHAVTIVRGEGSTVFDDHGRPYLDALASLWYCNVGHGRAELADAAAAQMRQLAAYQTFEPFSNQPAEALARQIAGLAPMPGAKVFFTPGGGSDAVDTAAKLARSYWRALGQDAKQITIARSHAYHGMNAYGTSLGGIPANTEPFVPLVSLVEHVAWDDAPALEKAIETAGAGRVAAFFCEPVVGAGGVYPPPAGYLASVREICRRHDVLFIADEVITGFGRTGAWLASERFGLDPDMITTAKGLSFRVRADRRRDRQRPGGRAVLAPRFCGGVPARLHLLRAPDRVRGRVGEPGPDRARAASSRGWPGWSRCWPVPSPRWPGMSLSARCAPGPGCSPPSRSPRRPAPPTRGSARGS